MSIIGFVLILCAIFILSYIGSILFLLHSLQQGFLTGEEFLGNLVIGSGSFALFFGLLIKFLNINKTKDLSSIKTKVNSFYSAFSALVVLTLSAAYWLGLWFDVSNTGLTTDVQLMAYYLIVEGALGFYASMIIGDLFELLSKQIPDDMNE